MAQKRPQPEKVALLEAVGVCGGQVALALELSTALGRTVSQQWIWNVIHRKQAIPADWCVPIERLTQAKGRIVMRSRLRPDVFPADEAAA